MEMNKSDYLSLLTILSMFKIMYGLNSQDKHYTQFVKWFNYAKKKYKEYDTISLWEE